MQATNNFGFSKLETFATTNSYHSHNYYELLLIETPGTKVFINDKTYIVEKKELFLLNKFDMHCVMVHKNQPFARRVIAFSHDVILPFETEQTPLLSCFNSQKGSVCNHISLTNEMWMRLARHYQSLHENYGKKGFGHDIIAKTALVNILIEINRMYREKDKVIHHKSKSIIPEVIEYIKENLQGDLKLESIASHFLISASHLSRLFKNYMSISIGEFILIYRVMEGKRLLSLGASVKSAGEQVGYTDTSNFIRVFKKYVGMSPKQYVLQDNKIENSQL